jgi:hypothetical protein
MGVAKTWASMDPMSLGGHGEMGFGLQYDTVVVLKFIFLMFLLLTQTFHLFILIV